MQLLFIAVFTSLMGVPHNCPQPLPPDSTYLTFTLEKGSITVRLLHWTKRATTATELNHFVDARLPDIDPDKIIAIGEPKAKYKEFAPILEVLKKHDWLKFKFQDKNQKQKAPLPSPKGERVFLNNRKSAAMKVIST